MSNIILTSNEEVAAYEVGDDMAHFIGFVRKWGGSERSANGSAVARMLLSNNHGTKLQVTAWAKLITKIEANAVVDWIIEIDGAKVIDLTGKQKYNYGNVNKELRICPHTEVRKLGVMIKTDVKEDAQSVTMETITSFIGTIKLEATLLNSIRLSNTKGSCYGIGSIADNGSKLEIKVYKAVDSKLEKYFPGQRLALEGTLKKRNVPDTDIPAPAFLEIEDFSKIKSVNAESRMSVADLMKVYKYIKIK